MEGVLASGQARVSLAGECARCLEPIEDELEVEFQELYVYPESEAEEDEASRLDGELLDLEPTLRDAVVLALPFQPVCQPDCQGLCLECGARLRDDPGHRTTRASTRGGRRSRTLTTQRCRTGRRRPPAQTRSNRGCSEAEDVAQQHAPPPFAVEGRRALARDVRQPGVPVQAPAAPRLPGVRPVRRPRRPASGPLTIAEVDGSRGWARPASSCALTSGSPISTPSCCSVP